MYGAGETHPPPPPALGALTASLRASATGARPAAASRRPTKSTAATPAASRPEARSGRSPLTGKERVHVSIDLDTDTSDDDADDASTPAATRPGGVVSPARGVVGSSAPSRSPSSADDPVVAPPPAPPPRESVVAANAPRPPPRSPALPAAASTGASALPANASPDALRREIDVLDALLAATQRENAAATRILEEERAHAAARTAALEAELRGAKDDAQRWRLDAEAASERAKNAANRPTIPSTNPNVPRGADAFSSDAASASASESTQTQLARQLAAAETSLRELSARMDELRSERDAARGAKRDLEARLEGLDPGVLVPGRRGVDDAVSALEKKLADAESRRERDARTFRERLAWHEETQKLHEAAAGKAREQGERIEALEVELAKAQRALRRGKGTHFSRREKKPVEKPEEENSKTPEAEAGPAEGSSSSSRLNVTKTTTMTKTMTKTPPRRGVGRPPPAASPVSDRRDQSSASVRAVLGGGNANARSDADSVAALVLAAAPSDAHAERIDALEARCRRLADELASADAERERVVRTLRAEHARYRDASEARIEEMQRRAAAEAGLMRRRGARIGGGGSAAAAAAGADRTRRKEAANATEGTGAAPADDGVRTPPRSPLRDANARRSTATTPSGTPSKPKASPSPSPWKPTNASPGSFAPVPSAESPAFAPTTKAARGSPARRTLLAAASTEETGAALEETRRDDAPNALNALKARRRSASTFRASFAEGGGGGSKRSSMSFAGEDSAAAAADALARKLRALERRATAREAHWRNVLREAQKAHAGAIAGVRKRCAKAVEAKSERIARFRHELDLLIKAAKRGFDKAGEGGGCVGRG